MASRPSARRSTWTPVLPRSCAATFRRPGGAALRQVVQGDTPVVPGREDPSTIGRQSQLFDEPASSSQGLLGHERVGVDHLESAVGEGDDDVPGGRSDVQDRTVGPMAHDRSGPEIVRPDTESGDVKAVATRVDSNRERLRRGAPSGCPRTCARVARRQCRIRQSSHRRIPGQRARLRDRPRPSRGRRSVRHRTRRSVVRRRCSTRTVPDHVSPTRDCPSTTPTRTRPARVRSRRSRRRPAGSPRRTVSRAAVRPRRSHPGRTTGTQDGRRPVAGATRSRRRASERSSPRSRRRPRASCPPRGPGRRRAPSWFCSSAPESFPGCPRPFADHAEVVAAPEPITDRIGRQRLALAEAVTIAVDDPVDLAKFEIDPRQGSGL